MPLPLSLPSGSEVRAAGARDHPPKRVVVPSVVQQSISSNACEYAILYRHENLNTNSWQAPPSIQMTPPRASSHPTTCILPTQTQPNRLAPVNVPCPRHRVSILIGFTFAPLSRSSSYQAPKPPERETDVTAISTTGLGSDPTMSEYVIGQAPVFPEDDGQTGPARKGTDSNV
ncbi:hypothetical protein EDB83DRAFT_438598 [Lactarius deliciosus]|nr:hypothetical protein EDB83DRAFT_438598 [Lactarius deliciosus]